MILQAFTNRGSSFHHYERIPKVHSGLFAACWRRRKEKEERLFRCENIEAIQGTSRRLGFALFWLLLHGQCLPRLWHASQNGPDPIGGVFNVHLLLPLIAGALFSWPQRGWRQKILVGMFAGTVAFVANLAFMIACGLVVTRFWERVSGDWGPLTIGNAHYVIEADVLGLAFGLIGATGSAVLAAVFGARKQHNPAPG